MALLSDADVGFGSPSSSAPSNELLDALRWQESHDNPNAVSPVGARGLYQIMPATALNPGFGVKPIALNKLSDPTESRRFASDYLGAMLKRYNGNEQAALAAYNAGPGRADRFAKYGNNPRFLPQETQDYIAKIQGNKKPPASTLLSDADVGFGAEPQKPLEAAVASQDESGLFSMDTLKKAAANAPTDLANTVLGIAEQNVNPILSGQFGYQLATNPEVRQEVGQHFANYLTPEGIKKNITEHPVGTALDASILLGRTPKLGGAAVAGEEATLPRIMSAAELKQGAGAGLNAARDSGVYFTPEFTGSLADTLNGIAKQRNFRPGRSGSADIEQVMKDVNTMRDRPWSFNDVQQLSQDLNDAWLVAKKSGRESVAGLAGHMRSTVDKFLANVEKAGGEGLYATGDLTPEQATKLLRESNKIYRQAKVAEGLDKMANMAQVDAVQFAQSGEANALRKYARQTLRQHYKKGNTGLTPDEIQTLRDFNRGSLSEWWLKQARRYFHGVFGAILGTTLGGPIAGVAAAGLGKWAASRADRIAVQRFTAFRDSVLQNGSERLQSLLGQSVNEHIMGTPQGRSAVSKWVHGIGTASIKGLSKGLATIVAQQVKQPHLAPRIEAELNSLAQQIQGTAESQAEPDQQQ